MKKIFTLLVAVGIITFAQAQAGYGQHSGRDQRNSPSTVEKDYHNGYDNGRDGGDYDNDRNYNGIISPERQRDLAIDRINREYDFKIQNVRDNFFKSRSQKRRQIRFLNDQREQEIRMTYVKFSHETRRYNDHDHRSNRRY
jgi:hypothetical protein